MEIGEFQKLIERIYFERDSRRGLAGTHMWFCEEVGELTRALRRAAKDGAADTDGAAGHAELEGEFADVLAWLATLASMARVDLDAVAARKYARGCPRCRSTPCACP